MKNYNKCKSKPVHNNNNKKKKDHDSMFIQGKNIEEKTHMNKRCNVFNNFWSDWLSCFGSCCTFFVIGFTSIVVAVVTVSVYRRLFFFKCIYIFGVCLYVYCIAFTWCIFLMVSRWTVEYMVCLFVF